MTEFLQVTRPETPSQLYHYTQPANIISMLDASNKSVCFWLKNNKDKNDEKELKYGRELMEKVRNYLHTIGQSSLLDQMMDFDNSYSASFTEGILSDHMLSEYGTARLEFDFRNYAGEHIFKCEYYSEEELEELCDVFIDDFKSMSSINAQSRTDLKLGKLFCCINLEWDLKTKIASIKLKDDWESEGEWRIVLHKQDFDDRYFVHTDGKERLKLNIPLTFLTGITLFYDDNNMEEMKDLCKKIKNITQKDWLVQFNINLKKRK